MLIDKEEVLYHLQKALDEEPDNGAIAMMRVKVATMPAAVAFICNGEACETETKSCRYGGPEACSHTLKPEYALNFEPIKDDQGRCFGFREKERPPAKIVLDTDDVVKKLNEKCEDAAAELVHMLLYGGPIYEDD